MNTEQGSKGRELIAVDSVPRSVVNIGDAERVLRAESRADALEKAAAALESQNTKLEADRIIERYFWILGFVAIANTAVFSLAPWHAATVLLIFSVVLLLGLGKWWQIPYIAPYLERWFDKITGNVSRPGETE